DVCSSDLPPGSRPPSARWPPPSRMSGASTPSPQGSEGPEDLTGAQVWTTLLTPPAPLSTYSCAASSSSHWPCSSRYLKAKRCDTGRVTLTLLVPLRRGLSGWTNGSQPLKSPTTDTLPAADSLGRTKLTLTF